MLDKILGLVDNKDISPITGLDAAFLYAETPSSPMHIGSVAIIEGSLEFNTFKKSIESSLHQMPVLRKRLMFAPMSVDYPYWVDDPDFNINLHIQRYALPRPGGWSELREMAAQIFSEPLDRSRPLWSFAFVEGIDDIGQVPKGSVALISKLHHVAVDGVAGAGLISLIFNISPEIKELKPPRPFSPKPLPNEAEIVLKSALSFAKNPLKLPKIISTTAKATIKSGMLSRMQNIELPTAPFSAPKTPLNGIISPERKWSSAILSLERIKVLKTIMGTTINDIILAFCAGALRRYLLEKDKLPKKPLVTMIPVSVRDKNGADAGGNHVSNMLVQLATNIEDPIERLEVIHENTIRGKIYQNAMGAKMLSNLAEVVPFGIANQASRLYTRFHVSKLHNPVFNVVITNVPGPQMPLYMQGHKLHTLMGMAPIIDGMGLIITVFSYNGTVSISPTSDAKSMPDIELFTRYIREAANELEALVLARETLKEEEESKDPESDKFFNHIKKYLKDNPDFIKPNSGIFQFNINGTAEATWKLDFNKAPGSVRRGNAADPNVILTISDKHLMRIATGDLDIQTAFVQGRLDVKGDMKKTTRLAKVLSLIPKMKK
ncbi:MAG: diacylglycerol O-acyltransferase [Saprospiraceae bacterium]|jgi:diacylglycerol O-acyltransferase